MIKIGVGLGSRYFTASRGTSPASPPPPPTPRGLVRSGAGPARAGSRFRCDRNARPPGCWRNWWRCQAGRSSRRRRSDRSASVPARVVDSVFAAGVPGAAGPSGRADSLVWTLVFRVELRGDSEEEPLLTSIYDRSILPRSNLCRYQWEQQGESPRPGRHCRASS